MRETVYIIMGVVSFVLMASPLFAFQRIPSIWPVKGTVTSDFGYRRVPLQRIRHRFHEGVDIASPRGTPIRASADGQVTFAGYQRGYGKMVMIDHGSGVFSVYGHASQLLVKKGTWVHCGTTIARVGSTGFSTGPHLHYEVHVGGVPSNPRNYIAQVI